jgi:hypothetical protein
MPRAHTLLACALLLPLSAGAQPPTALARAEQRLAEVLRPGARFDSFGPRSGPVRWQAALILEQPTVPLSVYKGMPPLPDAPPRKPAAPRPPREEAPLLSFRQDAKVPARPELATAPLLRLLSPNVKEPLPLPILAQPVKDRASLADPTLEASIDAALQPLAPARTNPLPFTPQNLPDPFENVPAGQLRNPPEESASPPIIPLRTPTR